MRVALFATCLVDTVFPQAARSALRVLSSLGIDAWFPSAQTCCGQMHVNSGYRREGLRLLRRTIDTFETYDYVVAPSGSCAATVREMYAWLAAGEDDADLTTRASALAARTYELAQFIIDVLGTDDVGASFPHKVVYHDSCHTRRGLGSSAAATRLLSSVRDLDLHILDDAAECCGFGGTFAVKNAAISEAMLADKLRSLAGSGAEVCTATDVSCLMHIGGGLRRRGEGIRTMHLAEILACGAEDA